MPEPSSLLSATGRELPKNWFAIICIIWAGQAVSIITSYAAQFAAIWYVTETTGSALALAIMSICAYLPIGLLSPFGGVIADRYNRKTIMILSDLSMGVMSFILGVVILLGNVTFPLLVALIVVRGIGQALHSPSMMATMPLLVPEKHLMRINSLSQALASLAGIGAPAFGILLYTAFGFHTVMFLDAFGAVVAVAGLALANIPLVRDEEAANQHVLANLADGWRAFSANRGLVVMLVGVGIGMMVFGPLGAVYPLMTYDHFGGGGYEAALVEGVWGVGMLVGAGVLMAWGGGKRPALLVCVSMAASGAATAACGFLPPTMFWLFVVLVAFMAAACSFFSTPFMTLVQKNVAEEKLGRAMGLSTAVMGLASPLGIALGGVVAEAVGVAPFFLIDGVLFLLIGVALYLPRSVRALDK